MGAFGWLVLVIIVVFVVGAVVLEIRGRRPDYDDHPPDPDVNYRRAKRDAEKEGW
jgi:hypothetical protein